MEKKGKPSIKDGKERAMTQSCEKQGAGNPPERAIKRRASERERGGERRERERERGERLRKERGVCSSTR